MNINELFLNKYVIIRRKGFGVVAGTLIRMEGDTVALRDARSIWPWCDDATLFQLASEGVDNHKECNFSAEVSRSIYCGVTEILGVSDKVYQSLRRDSKPGEFRSYR